MTEADLQKKLQEWLAIKGEADALEKSMPIMKDDKPHPAGSPEERSHAVAEGKVSLPKAAAQMNAKGHESTQRFFNHLRSLKDPRKQRSPENNLTPAKKSESLDKNAYLKDMLKQVRAQKKLPETPQAGNTLDYSKMKPAPQGRVEGQRMHPRSVESGGPRSNKLFDPRLSGKIKKSLMPQPAAVSEPTIIETRAIRDNPKEIQSPNTLNAHKEK